MKKAAAMPSPDHDVSLLGNESPSLRVYKRAGAAGLFATLLSYTVDHVVFYNETDINAQTVQHLHHPSNATPQTFQHNMVDIGAVSLSILAGCMVASIYNYFGQKRSRLSTHSMTSLIR